MESLGSHQVLCVETDSTTANFTEQLLSGWGLIVSIAKSSREAIELSKTHIYDLILMAIKPGDSDGYETARIIRSLGEPFQHVPIIGHSSAPAIGDTKENELTDFILDPFDQTELYTKLKNHLDKCQPDVVLANLDRCTEGDNEFRRELALLLANNITEMMTNIEKSVKAKDPNILLRSVHKTKTTLSILDDNEMSDELSVVEEKLRESAPIDLEIYVEKLINRCARTVTILKDIANQ